MKVWCLNASMIPRSSNNETNFKRKRNSIKCLKNIYFILGFEIAETIPKIKWVSFIFLFFTFSAALKNY